MLLAVDIGNTNIVVGCIDREKTYFIERLSTVRTKTELEYAEYFRYLSGASRKEQDEVLDAMSINKFLSY